MILHKKETTYLYGKNNEIIKLRENKQRIIIDLKYDDNDRATQRKFSSGVTQNKVYDNAGRVVFISQNVFGKTTWAEGYVYAEDGKRTGTVDLNGAVTLYEYNKRGKLSAVYYPYTKAMVDKFKAEADENKLSVNEDMAENKFLDAVTKGKLAVVLNYAGFGFGDRITTMQLFIKESYEYDRNCNRIKTVTKNGAIDYSYDEENRLVSSGSNGRVCVKYTYDRNGNMLAKESSLKSEMYSYNSQNRLCESVVIDRENKTQSESRYAYDAFGLLVQGDLSGAKDLGYLGKQFDKATGLYNYGYRDYKPDVARFTTVDPIRDGTNWYAYCSGDSINYIDPNGREQVYFIYTYKNTEYDQKKMKAPERNSINDDISWLENKGVSVKVLESSTKQDILNAISDNEVRIIITSGHGYENNGGIQTSDSGSFRPSDLYGQKIGTSLNTVIFENCYQGDMEDAWESAFGNNIDVVGWKGETNTFETISFNGIGIFDRQSSNLRDYLIKSVVTNEFGAISSTAPLLNKKGK